MYPEDYKWSSAKFYATGVDDFGFLTHFMDSG
jgi:putative transposase